MGPITDTPCSGAGGALETKQPFDAVTFGAKHGGVTVATLKPGTVLYSQGQPADALFYIDTGQVQITVVSSLGKEGILAVLDGDNFCGVGCLLPDRLRASTAICLAECNVARLERANILRAIHDDPAVAEFFLTLTLHSVVRLRQALVSQLFDSSETRLARVLLELARCSKGSRTESAIRNVDQEALAQMIGTTRSRVNHFMTKFRRLGYVAYDGHVILVRSSLLDALLHEDVFDSDAAPRRASG